MPKHPPLRRPTGRLCWSASGSLGDCLHGLAPMASPWFYQRGVTPGTPLPFLASLMMSSPVSRLRSIRRTHPSADPGAAGFHRPVQLRAAANGALSEAMHHRRGDIWASAAALLVTSALWFNLAHLALGAFRRDMEASCDASVLSRLGRPVAATYAETILRCAIRPPRSLCALTSHRRTQGRLTMLNANVGSFRRYAGLGSAGLLALSGIALAAAPEKRAHRTRCLKRKLSFVPAEGRGRSARH
jgi:hypothetical protein